MTYDVGMITTHVSPALGFGGVAVSAARLAGGWAKVASRRICLCATDASEKDSICERDVKLGSNVRVSLYHTYWFRRWGFGMGAIPRLIKLSKECRLVYVNGIATWPTTLGAIICCFFRRAFVVAPRGGLMPEHVSHIRHHKPAKWLFYRLLTFPTLRRAKGIHCTGKIEANSAQDILGKNPSILIVPNGVEIQQPSAVSPPFLKDRLVLTYIGRISHEKGINSFLQGWLKVRRPRDIFMIAGASSGPAEEACFKEFQRIVAESAGAIVYHGYVDTARVNRLIGLFHFIVLPSGLNGDVRENFGNAVAEALAVGRPVMVCRNLEWDDVENFGAGFVFDRHLDAAMTAVRWAAETTDDKWLTMAARARKYAEERLDVNVTAEQVWDALMECVGR